MGREQHLAVRPAHRNRHAVMADQRIVEQLRQPIPFARRANTLQQMAGQLELAAKLGHVLLLEMPLHRSDDYLTEDQQHHRGRRRKQQRQPEGQRLAAH